MLVCGERSRVSGLLISQLLLVLTLPVLAAGQATPILNLRSRIALPAVTGRMDHLGIDIKGHRLFATAFNSHSVEVIDVRTDKLARTLSNLAEPQGALYDPSSNRLFISSSMDGTVKIFKGHTLQLLKTVQFSSDADNLRYDTHSSRVVVGYGGEKFLRGKPLRGHGDGALAFLDSSGKKTGEIALDAHPESFQIEKNGTRVFVNVPDHKEVEIADVLKRNVVGRWPITICTDNFPMALDEAHHRLFVGCRTPSRLLVFNTQNGKIVESLPMVEHSDDLFYDAGKGRIYILGEGLIQVLQQKDPDHYDNIGRFFTPPDGRTGLFVPDWGTLFVPVSRHGTQDAEILVYRAN